MSGPDRPSEPTSTEPTPTEPRPSEPPSATSDPPPGDGTSPPPPPRSGWTAYSGGPSSFRSTIDAIRARLGPAEERIAVGSVVVVVGWLLLVIGRTGIYGASGLALLGALVALGLFYARYGPNVRFSWPVPYETVLLVTSAVVGLAALVTVIDVLRFLAAYGTTALFGLIVYVAGAALIAYGGYELWQSRQSAPPGPPPDPPAGSPPYAPPPEPPPTGL